MESQEGCLPFAAESRNHHRHDIPAGRNWHSHVVKIQSLCISGLLDTYLATGDQAVALVSISAWIATMEIIADVFVGTILALFAGIIALYNGAILIGTIIILISSLIFGFWLIVVIFSAHYNIQLPKFMTKLIKRFLSQQRADIIINYTNSAISDLCTMSRENFNSKRTI